MFRRYIFLVLLFFLALSCSADAKDKKETRQIDTEKIQINPVETVKKELIDEAAKEQGNARAIIALKIEALKWKKEFYAQQSLTMQLKYMIQCWNDTTFQDVHRNGREADKELKRLLILQ